MLYHDLALDLDTALPEHGERRQNSQILLRHRHRRACYHRTGWPKYSYVDMRVHHTHCFTMHQRRRLHCDQQSLGR